MNTGKSILGITRISRVIRSADPEVPEINVAGDILDKDGNVEVPGRDSESVVGDYGRDDEVAQPNPEEVERFTKDVSEFVETEAFTEIVNDVLDESAKERGEPESHKVRYASDDEPWQDSDGPFDSDGPDAPFDLGADALDEADEKPADTAEQILTELAESDADAEEAEADDTEEDAGAKRPGALGDEVSPASFGSIDK